MTTAIASFHKDNFYYDNRNSRALQEWTSLVPFNLTPISRYHERAFISMNTQNVVRLEIDDGNRVQVVDIESSRPFAIVLPLNAGNICFYDVNGNVAEYLRQSL